MRVVSVGPNLAGRKLGQTILGAHGQVLLRAGVTLTPAILEKLDAMQIRSIVIENELLPGLRVDEAVSASTRARTTQLLEEAVARLQQGRQPHLGSLKAAVAQIIDELHGSSDTLFGITCLRCVDDYTFEHSVNVAIYACILGMGLGYTRDDLCRLGVGGLVHDLGKIYHERLLKKAGPLAPEEREEMARHPWEGFEILRQHLEVSLLSSHVALQHHEKVDGTGYPRGLRGQAIHEFGRIGAIADIYDAMAADRVYRPRLPAHQVADFLRSLAGTHVDPTLLRVFLRRIALYPTGSIVCFDSHEVGIVTEQNPELPERPKVAIVGDERGNLIPPRIVDLATDRRTIRSVLEDYPPRLREQILRREGGPSDWITLRAPR